jgi:tight adherence protein C
MTLALLLGLGVGVGLAGAFYALDPAPAPLRRALLGLHRHPETGPQRSPGASGTLARLAEAAGARRLLRPGLRADLAITGRDETWLFSSALLLGLFALALGPVLATLFVAAGVSLPWGVPLVLSLVAGPLAAGAQVLSLRAEASRRRQDFAFALSAYLDLVVVSMAAGRGTEGALVVAAESGTGPAFQALRDALGSARLRGVAPWDALDELGEVMAVSELSGMAASIRLAGASGAKVRASLAARAKALRERGLAESRAEAESATERMSVPVVLLVLGFIVLIGYPAVFEITRQL